MDVPQYVVCHEPISPGQESFTLTRKGCNGIKRASEARGVEISAMPGQQVHRDCQRRQPQTNQGIV